jgi:hypothetical protein
MTTTTTTMTMTTHLQLYIAHKGCFKILQSEKHGKTFEFFFHALILAIVDSIAIVLLICPIR